MMLLSARTVWLGVPRDDGKWNLLQKTKNLFGLHHHTTMSLENGLKRTRLVLLEDVFVRLLGLGDPGLRWMFSEPDLLQRVWLFHLRPGTFNFHASWALVNTSFAKMSFGMDFRCVHLFQFLNVCDQIVSFPEYPRVPHIAWEFTWQDFLDELM